MSKHFTRDIYSEKAPDPIEKTPGFLFPLDSPIQMISVLTNTAKAMLALLLIFIFSIKIIC